MDKDIWLDLPIKERVQLLDGDLTRLLSLAQEEQTAKNIIEKKAIEAEIFEILNFEADRTND
jgi:uncharacterized membrane protein